MEKQPEQSFEELSKQILKGLEKAYEKMVEFKKQKNSPLVISKNGKVVKIPPHKIPPTTKYTR